MTEWQYVDFFILEEKTREKQQRRKQTQTYVVLRKAEGNWAVLDKPWYTIGQHETADFQLQGEWLWRSQMNRAWLKQHLYNKLKTKTFFYLILSVARPWQAPALRLVARIHAAVLQDCCIVHQKTLLHSVFRSSICTKVVVKLCKNIKPTPSVFAEDSFRMSRESAIWWIWRAHLGPSWSQNVSKPMSQQSGPKDWKTEKMFKWANVLFFQRILPCCSFLCILSS